MIFLVVMKANMNVSAVKNMQLQADIGIKLLLYEESKWWEGGGP